MRSRNYRYARAAALGLLTLLVVGVPTDIVANPWFGREIPVRWWEYPVLAATVLLTTAWFAIQAPRRAEGRVASGVLLAVFAVGCPVCNKIVLAAIGTSGALGLWAPVQPVLALVSLALLALAVGVRWRLRGCVGEECVTPG
ncbi:hypothetical protein [Actinophytocola sp. NPDC049390]|uniref:hypothetical protein n=1 Tax=Actinophytocola sp. NPDC049390 TaxID=3363894 RepID=UPI00378FC0FA